MLGWNGFIKTRGLDSVLGGEDSLGAYATQILGLAPPAQPAKDNPHVDRIVKLMAIKLKAGKPIEAGEIGLLSSAAKEGNTNAQKVIAVLKARGAVVSGDESGMDPWLYKLSPGYWLRSKTSKQMKDIEAKKWSENADIQKQLKKQQEDLNAAEKAAQSAAAVEASKAQSASTEAQLKEIQASLKGAMSGSFVGHEKVTPISKVILDALEKSGKREKAAKLYAKVKAGQALDNDEQKEALKIAKIVGRMKVVHGDLIEETDEAVAMHGAFVGACVMGGIDAALEQNAQHRKLADLMSNKVASGQPLSPPERSALAKTLKAQTRLRGFAGSLVSGKAFIGSRYTKLWKKAAFVGAAKTMSDEDKKMLASIVQLAKLGNPRAQKALAEMKKTNLVAGDSIGFGIKSFFKYATAPIWLPAKGISKLSQKVFGKGGSSPEQQRLNMMRNAAKRRKAFDARAAAADAQSEAEKRAQLAIADAADAEADAADAEALAKEQAMKTKEVEADPSQASSEGEFIGAWTGLIGKGTKTSKIVSKAAEQSPAGIKVRAGAKLYQRYRAGDPSAEKAIKIMAAKAKKGDPQALRDVNALKAGRIAVKARQKAQKKQAALAAREVRRKKSIAFQKGLEAKAANKLCQISRKRELKKHWKVERMAAAGNPKAKAYVAKQVAAAKKGDKKAAAHVAAMKQGRLIRSKVKTPRDFKNMRQAETFAKRLKKNDPKAMRQYRILQIAANKKDPNAIRAIDRIMLAAMTIKTIETGIVIMPRGKKSDSIAKKGSPANKQARQRIAKTLKKAADGTASREELAAGANDAHKLGDNKTAGMLANSATSAPSATEAVQKKVQQLNAAEANNPEAKVALAKDLEVAKKGEVEGIKGLGTTLAAKTVSDVNSGSPISPTMKDALNMNERIKAGDPVAIEQTRQITSAATGPNPPAEATLAAAGMVAAKVIDQTLAAKPKAREELMAQVNAPVPAAEKSAAEAKLSTYVAAANDGTITPSEGEDAVKLALRLRKPKLAAEISSKAPPYDSSPLSSLPDRALPPIVGVRDLLQATLQAFTFSTADPLANYRGGIANRGKSPSVEAPISASGWSPFDWFRKNKGVLPIVALVSAPIAAAASVANLMKPRKSAPAAAPVPAPAAPAAKPAAEVKETAAAGMGRAEICGSDEYVKLVTAALKTKKMSKDDFNKAVTSNLPSGSNEDAKKASGKQTLEFLQSKKVTVGGDSSGVSKDFKEYLVEAVKTKKMSKYDFNEAIDVHCGPKSSKEAKKAAGEKVLKFLTSKDVKVG